MRVDRSIDDPLQLSLKFPVIPWPTATMLSNPLAPGKRGPVAVDALARSRYANEVHGTLGSKRTWPSASEVRICGV
jgi:hypothetical protein